MPIASEAPMFGANLLTSGGGVTTGQKLLTKSRKCYSVLLKSFRFTHTCICDVVYDCFKTASIN
jgi:hypothetical protein